MMQQPFSDKQIIDYLKSYYGINVNELILLPIGADINASVYKAKTLEKQDYFVKLIYGHEHDAGLALLALLQQAKVLVIIPQVLTIKGQLLQRIDNVSLIVQPFIDGQNGWSHILTEDQWITLGKNLRAIHELAVPSSIQAQLRAETFSPKWRAQVQSFYSLFDDYSQVTNDDEVSQKLFNFIEIHKAEIHRLVDRAEALAQECRTDVSSFVLCHADLHAGNILIDKHNALYIVDWDNPILAPIERDLMFIGGGVGNIWNKQNEVALFYKGYGEVKINRKMLAYYRHERIVEDMAIYIQEIFFTHDKNRSEMYQHFVNMFEPRGVVEIAFETDKAS